MAEQVEPPRQARATRAGGKDAVSGEAPDQMGLCLLYRAIDSTQAYSLDDVIVTLGDTLTTTQTMPTLPST
jgi:hypothetical protein